MSRKKLRLLSASVLAGGGAVEAALSIYLESFATTLGSREQLAIAEFADALLTIPKTLAVNAAQVLPCPWLPVSRLCLEDGCGKFGTLHRRS